MQLFDGLEVMDSLEAASHVLFESAAQGGHDLREEGLVVAESHGEMSCECEGDMAVRGD
ncbi:MAG: hypothetical protein V3W41_19405 [Planctomycetota bacterium]